MAVFKCKMCGGTLNISENATIITCDYCRSQQTLPRISDEKISALYERANHYRRENEFDKAMGIYEQILAENPEDSESYWSIILCKYGIEYVEDPTTHERKPTVNRMQNASIFADENYKSALKYADDLQKAILEKEANAINEIQKKFFEISRNEEPFDIFICYKETDEFGKRTQDSVYANELYHELTKKGFKVFFAPITLGNKLGVAYEPYIFAALNSAKVMVTLATKAEYFNAVWVKNEWSRYLSLIKNGAKKTLIPAYKGFDAYELPQEFSYLQAQDMNELGFMIKLIDGIETILGADKKTQKSEAQNVAYTATNNSGTRDVDNLLKRVKIFLNDKNWAAANAKCEAVLDLDPENANAYIYKLLTKVQLSTIDELSKHLTPLNTYTEYNNALRFADNQTSEKLIEINKKIIETRQKMQAAHDEQVRLKKEHDEKVAAKEKELTSLLIAKKNTAQLLSSQVAKKEYLEKSIQNNIIGNSNFENTSKKIKYFSFAIIGLTVLNFLLLIITMGTETSILPFFAFVLLCIVTVFDVLITKITNGSLITEGLRCYFTFGIFGVILAVKSLKKYKTNNFLENNKELSAQLQTVEQQLNELRRSLSEINQKIEICKSKSI